MLYDGLPDSAPSKREDPDEEMWGATEELLAQVIEEVSVLAAGMQREKPRQVLRPHEMRRQDDKAAPGVVVHENGAVTATGLQGMLAMSRMAGTVRTDG